MFLVVLLAFFLMVPVASAAPGHGPVIETGSEQIGGTSAKKKRALKKEVRSLAKKFSREINSSKEVWQKSTVREPWQADSACVRDTLLEFEGPITDLKTLYTLSAVRAISLHIIGPDGKPHSSFKESLRRLQKIKTSTRYLQKVVERKIRIMKALAGLPRYQRSICPMLRGWKSAGYPDLLKYSGLYKSVESVRELSQAKNSYTPYQAADAAMSIFNLRVEGNRKKASEFARWFIEEAPYMKSFHTNEYLWKQWTGENYPPPPSYFSL